MSKRITTYDHKEIKEWIENKNGKPVLISGAEPARALSIQFSKDTALPENSHEIDWEAFFNHFEKALLAFQYEEPENRKGNPFYKFVGRTL